MLLNKSTVLSRIVSGVGCIVFLLAIPSLMIIAVLGLRKVLVRLLVLDWWHSLSVIGLCHSRVILESSAFPTVVIILVSDVVFSEHAL